MNAYCVILRSQPLVDPAHVPSKRFYLLAPTADRAMRTASDENPQFRVIGVEPSELSYRSAPTRSEAA